MFARNFFLLVAENAWVLVRTLDILAPIDRKEFVLFLMTYLPDEVKVVGRVGFGKISGKGWGENFFL